MGQFVPKPAFDLTRFLSEKAKPGAKRWGAISRGRKAAKAAKAEGIAEQETSKANPA